MATINLTANTSTVSGNHNDTLNINTSGSPFPLNESHTIDGGAGNDNLTGGNAADTIYGGNRVVIGATTIVGGNDTIAGGGGSDVIYGDDAGDTVGGNDVLEGGAADDTVYGGAGNDALRGGDGNDFIVGGDGTDSVSLDSSESSYWVEMEVQQDGSRLARYYTGTSASKTLFQTDTIADDVEGIAATTGSDFLLGSSGNDVFTLLTPWAGQGTDTIDGRGGNNTIQMGGHGFNNPSTVNFTSATGGTLTGASGTIQFTNIQRIIFGDTSDTAYGGDGNDNFDGQRGRDQLFGGAGDDILSGSFDNDTLSGGTGNDTISGGSGEPNVFDTVDYSYITRTGPGISVALNDSGSATVTAAVDDVDRLDNIENIIGTSGDDTLSSIATTKANHSATNVNNRFDGGGGDDRLFGGTNNDTLIGGLGRDLLDGGSEIDTADYSYASAGITFALDTLGAATVTVVAGSDVDTLSGIENIVGTELNDSISATGTAAVANIFWGGAGNDNLNTGDGNDTLSGGIGNDTLAGGGGSDTADYSYVTDAARGLTFALDASGNATVTVVAGSDVDELSGVENIIGGAGNDWITGNDSANTLSGGMGNDSLEGRGGSDSLDGGAGNNYVDGGNGNDALVGGTGSSTLDGGADTDTVTYANAVTMTFDAATLRVLATTANGTDTLTGIEIFNGSSSGDRLAGAAGAETLQGFGGNDTLMGGAGNDLFDGGSNIDWVDYGYVTGNGVSVVFSGTTATVTVSGNDIDQLTAIEGILGSNQNDTLNFVNASNDWNVWTDGRGGNDTITGRTNVGNNFDGNVGDDVLYGGNSEDNLGGGSGNDSLYGGNGNETQLYGGFGNDFIDGGAGTDRYINDFSTAANWIFGASGNALVEFSAGGSNNVHTLKDVEIHHSTNVRSDTYIFDRASNPANFSIWDDGGTDVIQTSQMATVNLAKHAFSNGRIENLTYTGTGDFTGTGALAANRITAGGGNSTVGGNDILSGGGGNDSLFGGGGNDQLFGESTEQGRAYLAEMTPLSHAGYTSDRFSSTDELRAWNAWGNPLGAEIIGGTRNLVGAPGSAPYTTSVTYDVGDATTFKSKIFVPLTSSVTGQSVTFRVWLTDASGTRTAGAMTVNGNASTSRTLTTNAAAEDVAVTLIPGTRSLTLEVTSETVGPQSGARGAWLDPYLEGGTLNQTVSGGADDELFGGAGNDIVRGGYGHDTLSGGTGNDQIFGGTGIDRVDYSYATASVTVDLGAGTATGGATDVDQLSGIENVVGGQGNDSIKGDGGNNVLIGGQGDDTLEGGGGNDVFVAETGNGDDNVDGGDGIDTFDMTGISGGAMLRIGVANTQGSLFGADTITNFEIVQAGNGNDTIVGDAAATTMFGNEGNDLLVAGGSSDSLYGGAGNDTLDAGAWNLLTNGGFERAGGWSGGILPGTANPGLIAYGRGVGELDDDNFPRMEQSVTLAAGQTMTFALDWYALSATSRLNVYFVDGNGTKIAGLLDQTFQPAGTWWKSETVSFATGAFAGQATLRIEATGDRAYVDEARLFVPYAVAAPTLDGGAGDDLMLFTDNAETLTSANFLASGSDTFNAGGGNDTVQLTAHVSNATIDGGTGIDTLDFSGQTASGVVIDLTTRYRNFEIVQGGAKGDTIKGSLADQTLKGGDGNDDISVAGGRSELHGEGGDDTLFGSNGISTVTGLRAALKLDGGAGVDLADYGLITSGITVDLAAGTATFVLGTTTVTDALIQIEQVKGGTGNDSLVGDGSANLLMGNTGDDTLKGGAGNDTLVASGSERDVLYGGDNFDIVDASAATTGLTIDLTNNIAGIAQIFQVEGAIGGSGADTIGGNAAANSLDGGAGTDNIAGRDGNDSLYGGAGSDSLYGGDGNDSLYGGAGNDVLFGGGNSDYLDGGDGNADIADFSDYDQSEVKIEFVGNGQYKVTSLRPAPVAPVTTLVGIEQVRFKDGAETSIVTPTNGSATGVGVRNELFFSGDATSTVSAGGGNDVIVGFTSVDGGAGQDMFYIDEQAAAVDVSVDNGTFQVTNGTTTWSFKDIETLQLLGMKKVAVSATGDGTSLSELLVGTGGADTRNGGEGDDLMYGGAGADDLQGDNGHDFVVGGAGNDTLSGGAGDDTLVGGLGNNKLEGEQGSNWASYAGIDASVTVDLASGTATATGVSDTLNGIQNVIGSASDDELTGSSQDNILRGGAGNDTLDGGGGNDTADFSDWTSGVTVTLDNNAGQAQTSDGSHIDTLSRIANIAGTEYADEITGDGTANVITGDAGNDIVDGAGGTDTFVLSGKSTDYNISKSTVGGVTTYTVEDLRGYDGVDTLENIEQIMFLGNAAADQIRTIDEAVNKAPVVTFKGPNGATVTSVSLDETIQTGGRYQTGLTWIDLSRPRATDEAVGTFDIDDNLGDSHTVRFVDANGNVDANTMFYVDGKQLYLRKDAALDYETAQSLTLRFVVTDQSGLASAPFALTVNVNNRSTNLTTAQKRIEGSSEEDTLSGANGNATIEGGAGSDKITGGSGNDLLYGDSSTDLAIRGGTDTVDGGAGDDTIMGGGNPDQLSGGDGNDQLSYAGERNAVTINLDTSRAFGGSAEGDTISGFERFLTGDGRDELVAVTGSFNWDGGNGADTLDLSRVSGGSININLGVTGAQAWLGQWQDDALGRKTFVAATQTINDAAVPYTFVLKSVENVTGTANADSLAGNGAANYLKGGAGADTLNGGRGNDTLQGGSDDDTYYVDQAGDIIWEAQGGGIDTVFVNAVNYELAANVENMRLLGAARNVTGNALDNAITGNGAANIINGGRGADTLTGGGGADIASYSGSELGVTVDLSLATAQSGGDAQGDVLTGFRAVIGSNNSDKLTGDSNSNTIDGGAGGDSLFGGAGSKDLQDWIDYSRSRSAVTVDLSLSTGQSGGDADGDTLSGFENILGSSHADKLTGDENNNTIDGGLGGDTIDGGDGIDMVTYALSSAVTVILDGTGSGGLAAGDVLSNVEVVVGSGFDDTFHAGRASPGDVTVTLDGGAKIDTVTFANAKVTVNQTDPNTGAQTTVYQGVTVNLGIAPQDTGVGKLVLRNFESLIGSAYGDKLSGSAAKNTVDGGAGDDTVSGGGGNDIVYGAAGNDTVEGGLAQDTLYGGAGNDLLYGNQINPTVATVSADHFVIAAGGGNDTIADFDLVAGIYRGKAYSIRDKIAFDAALGLTEADIDLAATQTSRNKNINVWKNTDGYAVTFLDRSSGVDAWQTLTLRMSNNSTSGHNLTKQDFVFLTDYEGTAAGEVITGNDKANRIYGLGGDDTLTGDHTSPGGNDSIYGGVGSDQIEGRAGDDRLFGDDDNDTIDGGAGKDFLYGGAGHDRLTDTSGANFIYGGDGNDDITGANLDGTKVVKDQLFGDAGDDVITGGSSANRLEGGDGNDTLRGEGGNDTIFGDSSKATSTEAGADSLYGGAGNDSLSGGALDDQLFGGADSDSLAGGTGNDTLDGGAGNDTFQFELGAGNDRILGFADGDKISFRGLGIDDQRDVRINPTATSDDVGFRVFVYAQGDDGVIRWDDGSERHTITVVGYKDLKLSDFSGLI